LSQGNREKAASDFFVVVQVIGVHPTIIDVKKIIG
jgi:hypothetical protein